MELQVILLYLLVSCYFLVNGMKLFEQGNRLAPEDVFLSVVIVVLVTTCWPLVTPFSWVQDWQARELRLENVLSVFVTICLLTVSGVAVAMAILETLA